MEADDRPHATPDETMLSLFGTLTTSCIVRSTAIATNLPTVEYSAALSSSMSWACSHTSQ